MTVQKEIAIRYVKMFWFQVNPYIGSDYMVDNQTPRARLYQSKICAINMIREIHNQLLPCVTESLLALEKTSFLMDLYKEIENLKVDDILEN